MTILESMQCFGIKRKPLGNTKKIKFLTLHSRWCLLIHFSSLSSLQYSQIFTQIFAVIYRNFSLRTVFQFQQLIIYKLVQFKFNDFQGPFTSNSKTFKDLFHFQGLSRPWKNEHFFKDFQGPVATLDRLRKQLSALRHADLNNKKFEQSSRDARKPTAFPVQ